MFRNAFIFLMLTISLLAGISDLRVGASCNAALAPTGKTYADNTGHSVGYAGELPVSITLARGGSLLLDYSNDAAKDLVAATWPAMTSGPFTVPGLGHGYAHNRAGNVKTLSDASGTRDLGYLIKMPRPFL